LCWAMGSDVDWREWSEFAKTTDGMKSDEIGLMLTMSCADDWLYGVIPGWWFGTWLLFSHILGMSSSQLTHIFQRGRLKPPTRYGIGLSHGSSRKIASQPPWQSPCDAEISFSCVANMCLGSAHWGATGGPTRISGP
jgi:hypothetical protein